MIGPGIVIVLVGLCIWLAGLRWRLIIGAIAGAAIAAAGVFVVGNYPVNVVLAISIVGMLAGVIINRIILGIFGAVCGALIVMVVLAGMATAKSRPQMVEFQEAGKAHNPDEVTADNFVSGYPTWPEYEIKSIPIPISGALEITVKTAGYFVSKAKAAIASAGIISFAGAGITAVIAAIAVLIVPRLFVAVVSSTLGSAIIFAGMIMLLFFKNSRPITYIADKPQFYAAAFGAMVLFGTIIQLILSPSAFAKVLPTDKEKGEN